MALYSIMKGPVDYTVVGSPTITDGVASGFSSSNYVSATINPQNVFTYEEVIRVKIPSTFTQRNYITGYATDKYGWALSIPYTSKKYALALAKPTSDTSAWRFDIITTVEPIYDQFYYIRFTWNGSRFLWEHSTDRENWSTIYSYNSSDFFYSSGDKLYGRGATNQSWYNDKFLEGEIDLNNTYIKVNDQVWFGHGPQRVKIRTSPYARYTVRNGVTIQNGVASGFAEGNSANAKNIDIPSIYPLTANSKIHLEFTPAQGNFGSLLGKALSNYGYCIRYLSENVASSYLDIYDTTGRIIHQVFTNQAAIVTGNRHTFDLEYNGTTYTVLIKDIDTNTTIVSGSLNYTQPSNSGTCGFCIGGTRSVNTWYVYLKASINLNNSYIIANGQYIWRGDMQNVETWTPHIFSNDDYLIENGKLIQVNPNIYCQSTGTQYIDTGILPSSNIEFDVKFLTSNTIGVSGYGCIFGGRYNSGNNDLQVTTFKNSQSDTSGTFRFGLNSTDASQSAGITLNVATEAHFHNLTYSTNTVNYTVSTFNFTNPRKIFLFGLNGNGTFTQAGNGCKIYFAKFSKGTAKYHFVPVPQGLVIGSFTVPSNGMFDIVSQTFYGNAGSGNFTIGKDE